MGFTSNVIEISDKSDKPLSDTTLGGHRGKPVLIEMTHFTHYQIKDVYIKLHRIAGAAQPLSDI